MMTLRPSYDIPALPLAGLVETPAILRAAAVAHRHLATMNGKAAIIPNPGILIDTLILQEAKASSEIENIVTTQDEVLRTRLFPENPTSPAAKEVALYGEALHRGFGELREHGLLTNRSIIGMFQTLKRTDEGFRQTPGTALKNESSGRLVYIPPQDRRAIEIGMSRLERYINDAGACALDPLIRMAIIHHQFESIHPFADGNGRIGRIINVLYLVQQNLLDLPILYLSRAITRRKSDYYRLLQRVRDTGDWEDWILYMLTAVSETSIETLRLIEDIHRLMADYKGRMRRNHTRIYSQDLLNNLFRHPYTRVEFVQRELGISRPTATKYLDTLADAGFVTKQQAGRNNYYVNDALVSLFMEGAAAPTIA